MNGDIDAYHGPMDMLHDATQYLEHMRQTLIEADRFEAFIQSTILLPNSRYAAAMNIDRLAA
jgi:hypothetical protein